jgi:hypothetical protein
MIKEFKRFLTSNSMLFVCTNIKQFHTFAEKFKQMFEHKKVLDLSKVGCSNLAAESLAIVNHHSDVVVFLGYLEPGWMLEPAHQVQLRKLIRKFPVAILTKFVDSIPFSWKNEIDTLYSEFL